MEKIDIKSMTLPELKEAFASRGYESFRAKQVFQWLHCKNVNSFDEMTNISSNIKGDLTEDFYITSLKIGKRLVSKLDNTVKYLYELPDGNHVESVRMSYKHGNSVCISTQVGCKMGCSFCASTIAGFVRNLTPSEILEQVYAACKDAGQRVSNVVLMGIGEPLDNYDNVLRFLKLLSDEDGFHLSLRHVSLSTCGVVPNIYRLAEEKLQLTLSISLHAPNDEIRSRTMPVNRRWNIDELLEACRYYEQKTGRRISYEYALISGVNDSLRAAEELASRLKGTLCHVNLIPVNSVAETGYRASTKQKVFAFQKYLNDHGIPATVRRTLGADIDAACGQLRREQLDAEKS